jgi:hypothetical protein
VLGLAHRAGSRDWPLPGLIVPSLPAQISPCSTGNRYDPQRMLGAGRSPQRVH